MTPGPRLDYWGDVKLPRRQPSPARLMIPLLVWLCLLPGMGRVVGDVTVRKARALVRLRRDQARHPELAALVRERLTDRVLPEDR